MTLHAQKVGIYCDTLSVFFRQGETTISAAYENNGDRILDFVKHFDNLKRKGDLIIDSLTLVASASPEGVEDMNAKIAFKRQESLREQLEHSLHYGEVPFRYTSVGSNWKEWREQIATSSLPQKQEVLEIIDQPMELVPYYHLMVDKRLRILQTPKYKKTWDYTHQHHFPYLRRVDVFLYYTYIDTTVVEVEEIVVEKLTPVVEPEQPKVVAPIVTPVAPEPLPELVAEPECQPFYLGIGTNLLYDMAAVPHLSADLYLGKNWSLNLNYIWGWWKTDKRHRYWRLESGDLEIRRWFGEAAGRKPLTGHHIGIYGQRITYDFEWGKRGYLGDRWIYGVGLSYGYSLPIATRWNLNFTLGLGYLGGTYKEYLPIGGRYIWQATKKQRWLGPTKMEVTLTWLVGCNNRNVFRKAAVPGTVIKLNPSAQPTKTRDKKKGGAR